MKHIFISPHMDDAVLSAGSYMCSLIQRGVSVSVVNIFTDFGCEPIPAYSRKYIKISTFNTIEEFSRARINEDKQAMHTLGAKPYYLHFIDGGFRKRAIRGHAAKILVHLGTSASYVYPTAKSLFSGKISPADEPLRTEIARNIKGIVHREDIVYGPLGIGGHADHLIVRDIVRSLPNKKLFWADQPYVMFHQIDLKNQVKYRPVLTVSSTNKKREVFLFYASQVHCLFPKGITFLPEVFYEQTN